MGSSRIGLIENADKLVPIQTEFIETGSDL